MKAKSCKAKGRELQNEVRDELRRITQNRGLVDADIEGRPMGQKGVDVILSPAAKKILDLAIECKKQERLPVPSTFWKHYKKYEKDPGLKLLIHQVNYKDPLVTLRMEDFMALMQNLLVMKQVGNLNDAEWVAYEDESAVAA